MMNSIAPFWDGNETWLVLGGGGLFAAEYSMVGPIDDPEIKTNPLTALTPGIFRKIFQILPGKTTNGLTTDWPDPDDPN